MNVLAVVLACIIAVVSAAKISLPVTQDFAVVNARLSGASIAKNPVLSLFNNGVSSSIAYFGVDMNPIISEAGITTSTPVSSVVVAAKLIINNYTMIGSFGSDPVSISFSYLNPGQVWTEEAMTVGTTPSVRGSMGVVTFTSTSVTVLDVTQFIVESLSMPYQTGLFGFQVGLPGGPVEIPSHRSDADAIVVEVTYSKWVPGQTAAPTTAPTTSAPTSTSAPAPSTAAPTNAPSTAAPIPPAPSTSAPTNAPATSAPSRNCWTCGAGYAHWYDLGLPEPSDPCACIQVPSNPPATSAAPQGSSTPTAIPQTSSPKSDERNGSAQIYASALVFVVSMIALLL